MFIETFPPIDIKNIPSISISSSTTISSDTSAVFIYVDSTASAITVTLPPVASVPVGRKFVVKDSSGTSKINNITVEGNGSETLDDELNFRIDVPYAAINLINNGSGWEIW